ncbi:helix-turn-helix domain-containing protein [Intestinibacter bartlettii]|uniref:helix-turn-helix domain-containing protein n=1 Tax=Intestinibacter bartlettii TaxID=261299 RepID=UPI00209F01E2|nr:helix-turn-helix transcriptional regulator [Intestinibacter bartlettii]MDO5010327.1 helix-turn-helix transcriptional regulator [Intestinibacter bartlettii]
MQELRKQKGLTQEQLAEQLYVSRAAVSKWESGRGYPNIDSLKEISKYFEVSLDELLSNEEILTVAEEDHRQKIHNLQDVVFGLLDCSIVMFFILPFFGQKMGDMIEEVPLLSLIQIHIYVKVTYMIIVVALILCGVLTLALQNCSARVWVNNKYKISLGLSAVGILSFILSQQPYAAMLTFLFFAIKALMLMKWA